MSVATSAPLLAAAMLNGLLLALALAWAGRRTPALRWLAALVAVLAFRMLPYPLGFAGAYDRWRWLTFLPYDATFALGPLLWSYVVVLARGAPPARWRWHLIPVALQIAYQLVAFLLPQPTKGLYYQHVHVPVVEPIGLAGVLLSLAVYTALAWRELARWQRWLDFRVHQRAAARCGVVRAVVASFTLVTLAGIVGTVRHIWITPLRYADRAPTMLGVGVLVYGLGLAGLRQGTRPTLSVDAAGSALATDAAMDPGGLASSATSVMLRSAETVTVAIPPASALSVATASVEPAASRRGRPAIDYQELGGAWTRHVREAGWYRDPDLTLATLARHLNVSPRTASRVLREGLGETFHHFVNRLRVEHVRARLADPTESRTIYVLALEAGFASKASFTRAMRQATGTTASELRQGAREG